MADNSGWRGGAYPRRGDMVITAACGRMRNTIAEYINKDSIGVTMKLTEINKTIGESVKENGGYCPCMLSKTPDTKCPCKEFREAESGAVCRCGRYKKEI